jgi:lycopene cyclase domain-containing protein
MWYEACVSASAVHLLLWFETVNSEYVLVLAATLLFPLVLSFDKRLPIWKNFGSLVRVMLFVAVPFWVWDVIVTARGHWSFNSQYIIGVVFLGLPIEEWLFFIVIVFVSVFTWEALKVVLKEKR